MNIKRINVGGTIIPTIPFIWYREEHIYCPVECAINVSRDLMKNIVSYYCKYDNIKLPMGDYFVIVQRNVLKNVNLYISYHGYAYGKEQKNLIIPINFNRCYTFISNNYKTSIGGDLKFIPGTNSLKENEFVQGSVHIHDHSFSPPGHFHFRIDENSDFICMLSMGICKEIQCTCVCLFIIINDFDSSCKNVDDIINKILNF